MKPIEKQADRLFSEFIRNRDGRCVAGEFPMSPHWGRLECAHLFSRRFKSTRWDPRNAVALCGSHHQYFTEHPLAWADWREARFGSVMISELLRKAYGGARPDVAAIVESLKVGAEEQA